MIFRGSQCHDFWTCAVRPDHLKGLRALKEDHPDVRRRILVCLGDKPQQTEDGIEILPAGVFAQRLWQGGLF